MPFTFRHSFNKMYSLMPHVLSSYHEPHSSGPQVSSDIVVSATTETRGRDYGNTEEVEFTHFEEVGTNLRKLPGGGDTYV